MIQTCNHSAVVHLALHIRSILGFCRLQSDLVSENSSNDENLWKDIMLKTVLFYVALVPISFIDDVQKISTYMHRSVIHFCSHLLQPIVARLLRWLYLHSHCMIVCKRAKEAGVL